MSRGIPAVKEWLVTLESGNRYRVLAPTRKLALLNFHHYVGYMPIDKIGLVKKPVGQRQMVTIDHYEDNR